VTEARQRIASQRAAIDANRNFHLAQSELQSAVNGGGSDGDRGEDQTIKLSAAQAASID
jgi:hypothetical protein